MQQRGGDRHGGTVKLNGPLWHGCLKWSAPRAAPITQLLPLSPGSPRGYPLAWPVLLAVAVASFHSGGPW
eukprot:scaffold24393_cov112-Isochrysis_galbana.AAC.3